jgi:DNA-binding Lrp family transcriptional regulator
MNSSRVQVIAKVFNKLNNTSWNMSEQKLLRLLRELLKNSRRSDRDIAKLFGSSQPTVSRMRAQLDKKGYIKTFTVVPDFSKLGYEVLVFTFAKLKSYPSTEEAQKIVKHATEWVNKHPNVIFTADGEGLGADIAMISFHRNYSKYAEFMRNYAMDWGEIIGGFQSFIVSLDSGFKMKPFDLKYLSEDK